MMPVMIITGLINQKLFYSLKTQFNTQAEGPVGSGGE